VTNAADTSASPTIGIDLGGTNLRVALVARDGEILSEEQAPTPDTFDELVGTMAEKVRGLTSSDAVTATGVGTAGMVDFEGTVHYAPNIPMLRRAPLGKALRETLGVPVVVDNDANAAAWGEVCHGAARGCRHALLITLGTGVGGGIILDGGIYRGAHGFAAEVGHWQLDPAGPPCACGEPGHWEAAASGTALGNLGRTRAAEGRAPNVLARADGQVDEITGHHVGDAAEAGEGDGLAILEEYAGFVALGFVGLANIFDPEVIVVSGGLVALGDLLLEPIRAAFDHHLEGADYRPAVRVVPAELGSRAGVVGAAALARDLAIEA
jgi:glucokinase